MFLQKSKMQTVGKINNIYFSVISYPRLTIFSLDGFFQKILNVSLEYSFKKSMLNIEAN